MVQLRELVAVAFLNMNYALLSSDDILISPCNLYVLCIWHENVGIHYEIALL
jgi:hypothetical protein